jgi:Family of unknown function (DUF5330)
MGKNIAVERTPLSTLPARLRGHAAIAAAGESGLMFFLLRMAFWLGVVLVLLPSGSTQHAQTSDVNTSEAISAASATVQDLRGLCTRQPDACKVGSQVAIALGYKAQAGAKMLYDFLSDALGPKDTGALPKAAAPRGVAKIEPVRATSGQDTLSPADLAPTWHGPSPKSPKHAV